jgi:hypothetical protein
MGRLFAETAIEIDAAIDRVWALVTGLDEYAEWNPFIVRVDVAPEGIVAGAPIRLHVRWPSGGGVISRERVTRVEPPSAVSPLRTALFAYAYDALPAKLRLVCAERVQRLEQSASGPTRYVSRIDIWGPLGPFIPSKKVQAGCEAQARALKKVAEAAR